MEIDRLIQIIQDIYNKIPEAGTRLEGLLRSDGLDTACVCAAIAITYYLVVHWFLADQPKQFFISTFDVLIKLSLAFVLLSATSGVARDIFVNATNEVTKKINTNADTPTEIVSVAFKTVQGIARGTEQDAHKSKACLFAKMGDAMSPASWAIKKFVYTTSAACKGRPDIGLFEILKHLPMILLTALCQIIAIIATTMMAIISIVVILMSKILIEIGLIVGPLLIGLAVLPYLSDLFDQWIRYLITAALMPIICWIMTTFMMNALIPSLQTTLNDLNKTAKNAEVYFAQSEVTMIAIALLSSVGAFLMWQVPGIAAALAGGSAGGANTKNFGKGFIGKSITRFTPGKKG